MTSLRIDLYSDTQTRPCAGMRDAMATAEVGDEQRFEDPSVNALCERIAEILGMEAAVFLPSGTMCNQISAAVHCRPGDEIIADKTSHILNIESGGAAVLARASSQMLPGRHGVFTGEQLSEAIRPISRYEPRTRMISVEQTANLSGGTVWPLAAVREIVAVAKEHDLILHMDGARLLNAQVAANTDAAEFTAGFDSAWIDFSKGLGAPVGAALAGSRSFIDEAWRWKQRIGGAMRQSGIVAAAALYALDHNVERLAEDHKNAQLFAERVASIPTMDVEADRIDTNIVVIGVARTGRTAHQISEALLAQGLRIGALNPTTLRAVTHLDVDRDKVLEAADIFAHVTAAVAAE